MYYALSMEQFYPNPLIAPFLAFHCMRVNVVTAVVVVVVTCHTHPEWRGQSCRRPPPGSTGQCGDTGAGRGEAEYRGQQAKQAGDHQVQDKQVPGVPVDFYGNLRGNQTKLSVFRSEVIWEPRQ